MYSCLTSKNQINDMLINYCVSVNNEKLKELLNTTTLNDYYKKIIEEKYSLVC